VSAVVRPSGGDVADAALSATAPDDASAGVPGWARIRTEDPDALASFYAAMAERSLDQMAPGPFVVSAELGRCGEVFVFRESCTALTQTWARFREPSYACVVPVEPFRRGRYFGQEIRDTNALTLEPGLDFWMVAPAEADYAGLVMPRSLVLRYASSLQLAGEEHLRDCPRLIDLPVHRLQALRRFMSTVLSNLERNAATRASAMATRQIEESAAVLLICTFLGRSRMRGAGRPKSSYERIARQARDLVVAHPEAPPTLMDLCEHLHVGVRALNYAFQHAVGTSAGEYLRVVRLNRVREELLAARGGGRVILSTIAARWGFWHASQFTRQYRALFGERPSETLRLEDPAPPELPPITGKAPARQTPPKR
jgi:AraC family transcriptional regulator, ethanolamine operon transcriptional activator